MRLLKISFFTFLILEFLFSGAANSYAAGPTCPFGTDTTMSVDTVNGQTICKSFSGGLGFNTVNPGVLSCQPVACPGQETASFPEGNECVYTNSSGQCFAGTGASGFNPTDSSNNLLCKDNYLGQVQVSCPKPMTLNIIMKDGSGKPMVGAKLTLTSGGYPGGKTVQLRTDINGRVATPLYSGDHFTVIPSPIPRITFTPTQFGDDSGNPGLLEMNTLWSCGSTNTQGGGFHFTNPNDSTNACLFYATLPGTPIPTPPTPGPGTPTPVPIPSGKIQPSPNTSGYTVSTALSDTTPFSSISVAALVIVGLMVVVFYGLE